MSEHRKKLRLGEMLVAQGLVSHDQLNIALMEQSNNELPIGRQLVRLGFVTEAMIRDLLANTIGQESIDLTTVVADPDALKMVPKELALRYKLLPIAFNAEKQTLIVAISDMFNVVALDQLKASLGGQIDIKIVIAGEAQLEEYVDQFYGFEL